jgi:hypothetical protein
MDARWMGRKGRTGEMKGGREGDARWMGMKGRTREVKGGREEWGC